MKLFSKMLAVVLTTVGAVGTVGGVVMFAVGGSHSAITITADGKEETTGLGLFNYKDTGFGDFSAFLKYTNDNRELQKTSLDGLKQDVKASEDAINKSHDDFKKGMEALLAAAAQQGLSQAQIEAAVAAATTAFETTLKTEQDKLNNYKLLVKYYEGILSAQGMYDLTVAGAVIMSIGIVAAALSAWASIKVENSEERKIAKKNKTTV